MTVQIAIISQNRILRESLKTLLGQISGFRVIYDGNYGDFMTVPDRFSPDILLYDAAWGEADCPAIIQRIRAFTGKIRVLVLADAADFSTWKNHGKYAIDAVLPASSGKKEIECAIRSILTIGCTERDRRGTFPADNNSAYCFVDTKSNIK